MKIKIKKLLANAVIPSYAKSGDAGMDLTATSKEYDSNNDVFKYGTGISIAIPDGYVGLLFPRSSIFKYDMLLTNSVGVIDSGYRGEVMFNFRPLQANFSKMYEVGDRVGQLVIMPFPKIEFEEVHEMDETERNAGGFGHTGK